MSNYPNEAKYKDILSKKTNNPSLPLAQLCAEKGITYQSYNNWAKKFREQAQQPASKLKISVYLSVRELTALISQGVKEVPISIEQVLRSLPDHEQRALAEQLGRMQIEQLANKLSDKGPEKRLTVGPNTNQ